MCIWTKDMAMMKNEEWWRMVKNGDKCATTHDMTIKNKEEWWHERDDNDEE
jgi:hypothetical protein